MLRFKITTKSANRPLLIVAILLCFGLLTTGCATLYIQPANIQQDSVELKVTVDGPLSPNGIAIIGLPPDKIEVICKEGGQLGEPIEVKLKNGLYKHTFYDVTEDLEFVIDPHTFVAFEVGQGVGPYKMLSIPVPPVASDYQKGYNLALQYQSGAVRDYRLVTELYPLSPSNRDKFLLGFQAAYIQANDRARGDKYIEILKQAITDTVYEQAFNIGKQHANKEATDESVQTTLKRSIGLGGFELGWKAGYIEGFVQEMLKKTGGDKENLYQQADEKYNLLRSASE
jgi:hypothetical protein